MFVLPLLRRFQILINPFTDCLLEATVDHWHSTRATKSQVSTLDTENSAYCRSFNLFINLSEIFKHCATKKGIEFMHASTTQSLELLLQPSYLKPEPAYPHSKALIVPTWTSTIRSRNRTGSFLSLYQSKSVIERGKNKYWTVSSVHVWKSNSVLCYLICFPRDRKTGN